MFTKMKSRPQSNMSALNFTNYMNLVDLSSDNSWGKLMSGLKRLQKGRANHLL